MCKWASISDKQCFLLSLYCVLDKAKLLILLKGSRCCSAKSEQHVETKPALTVSYLSFIPHFVNHEQTESIC